MHVVAAPDKFRGTASAAEVAAAIAAAVVSLGGTVDEVPMADGGEGTLDALGGPNRTSTVTGPLGDAVEAPWRLSRGLAVIEMARAAGLDLVGGAGANDPIAASTSGVGELVMEAVESGAKRVIVGVGGSATTDGGLGALRAMYPLQRLRGVELIVACDVRTRFVDAAEVFAPQKGASANQVELLRRRLDRLVQVYRDDYGVDVSALDRAGAAGGLAGGLAVVGATLVDGFAVVADECRLDERMEGADLVVTGEGFVDEQSFEGKVVGGVAELAAAVGVPALAIAGRVYDGVAGRLECLSLVEGCGEERALSDTVGCVTEMLVARLG